jgi:hypothetical protein
MVDRTRTREGEGPVSCLLHPRSQRALFRQGSLREEEKKGGIGLFMFANVLLLYLACLSMPLVYAAASNCSGNSVTIQV